MTTICGWQSKKEIDLFKSKQRQRSDWGRKWRSKMKTQRESEIVFLWLKKNNTHTHIFFICFIKILFCLANRFDFIHFLCYFVYSHISYNMVGVFSCFCWSSRTINPSLNVQPTLLHLLTFSVIPPTLDVLHIIDEGYIYLKNLCRSIINTLCE